MRLFELFDDSDSFHTADGIRGYIKNSKNYEDEDTASSQVLLFFKTSKQRTYLVATNKRLYCILDDARKDNPHINWSMGKKYLVQNGKLLISIKAHDKTRNTGLVDVGVNHKNWLYTKELFKETSIENSINKFIVSTMK